MKQNRVAWMMTAVFGTIYCLISLVNHYNFRTYGLDLGVYTHGVYSYSRLHWHMFTLGLDGQDFNHLGNHFSPIVALFSPLYYLFGSYTLLIVQIAAILFGGWGIYSFARERLPEVLPEMIMALFFSSWGIYSALAFDWHANVIAAMLVPWFVLMYEREDIKKTLLLFTLILLCKENMAVWMLAIVFGLAVKKIVLSERFNWKLTLGMFCATLAYFLLVQTVVMPRLNPAGISDHLDNYSHLGKGPLGVLQTALTKPRHIFYLLFESLNTDPNTFKLKAQLHFMVLVSGGIALIYRPHYLIMLAPIYAQKLLSSNTAHWGVYSHYSIEFAPIIALAFTEWLQHLSFAKLRIPLAIGFILSATIFNWHPVRDHTDFFRAEHYGSHGLNAKQIHKALELVPDGVPVSASEVIIPHLAGRLFIYHYPVVKDAEYVAVVTAHRNHYPLSEIEFQEHLAKLRNKGNWQPLYDQDDLLIVKRKVSASGNP